MTRRMWQKPVPHKRPDGPDGSDGRKALPKVSLYLGNAGYDG